LTFPGIGAARRPGASETALPPPTPRVRARVRAFFVAKRSSMSGWSLIGSMNLDCCAGA
jgi:hypothetical protein